MRKLGIAVLGTGPWGQNLIRTLTRIEQVSLVGACDVDSTTLARCYESCPHDIVLSEHFEDLVRDPRVEAVCISTPPETHAELAIEALRANRHVFVEKPMTLTMRDAERVSLEARRSRRQVMVGHLVHYSWCMRRLAALLRAGAVGDLTRLFTRRCNTSPGKGREGPWWALAPHDISLGLGLFGELPRRIASRRTITSGADRARARLEMSSARYHDLDVASGAPTRSRVTLAVGSRAAVLVCEEPGRSRLALYNRTLTRSTLGEALQELHSTAPTAIEHSEADQPLATELETFADAILHGRDVPTNAEEGTRVVAVLRAGQRSQSLSGAFVPVAQRTAQTLRRTSTLSS